MNESVPTLSSIIGIAFGFSVSLGASYNITNTVGVSLRGTFQGDSKSNVMIIPRLGMTARF